MLFTLFRCNRQSCHRLAVPSKLTRAAQKPSSPIVPMTPLSKQASLSYFLWVTLFISAFSLDFRLSQAVGVVKGKSQMTSQTIGDIQRAKNSVSSG